MSLKIPSSIPSIFTSPVTLSFMPEEYMASKYCDMEDRMTLWHLKLWPPAMMVVSENFSLFRNRSTPDARASMYWCRHDTVASIVDILVVKSVTTRSDGFCTGRSEDKVVLKKPTYILK